MPLQLAPFDHLGLDGPRLDSILRDHDALTLPRLALCWAYYRNPIEPPAPASRGRAPVDLLRRPKDAWGPGGVGRGYSLAQQRGLPPRFTSQHAPHPQRDIVIENDIAWRIHAMIDFLFGAAPAVESTAADPALRALAQAALDAAWSASGGLALLQDAALLGHVHGHVDLAVRADFTPPTTLAPAPTPTPAPAAPLDPADLARIAGSALRIELLDPARAVPVFAVGDERTPVAYVLRSRAPAAPTSLAPSPQRADARAESHAPRVEERLEILSAEWRQLYARRADARGRVRTELLEDGPNRTAPGRLPVAHAQNVSQPLAYAGLSEVEPLIPLQDELNTRLSDRAHRVAMQSFRMFLAKGLDGFESAPVGPGSVFCTDNEQASIQVFGGDAPTPGEDAHIDEIREALDKASAVPPLANGVIRAKIGNLTSENALRVTLQGLVARTRRKRATYGRAIAECSTMLLAALNEAGVLTTRPADRHVELRWPSPLPTTE